MADWEKIKAEYIATDTSYRELGQKYGVNYATIGRKAAKEGWQTQRQQHVNNTLTKILDVDTEQKVDRATKLYSAADELLNKIVAGISSAAAVTPNAAKNYSDALKNIKEIHMIRSAEDVEEQKARIAKLQKEAKNENNNEPIRVVMDDDAGNYSK